MKLKVIHSARYKIAAVMNGDSCDLEAFFNELSAKYNASATGLFTLIDRIAKEGLDGLSSQLWHMVDNNEKIFELIKGDLRLLFFKGNGDVLIIASHGFIKKSQKTPDKEKTKAIRHKKQYQTAHDQGSIRLVEESEEN
ncbi:type II toxin-antitoxin system RelE/ParE family toxin [Methylomonas sp. MK1]|uniref:type II toxin-antitoxin system RelE/ParE family toxin n=1 Tax=Methylomonas sp. MK1 TaxID=1131552 RepID=UPI00035D3023|nr:type II toxin-antitoxin system RelE/ParE family toxin [Methylomonas sp. MK1]